MVKLDAKTGKMQWHYQQTPHDIYDWDFQDPPLLINAGGRELAIGAGKSGIVVALDAKTGKPVWKRPVGTHNGHDDDGLYAMRGENSKIKHGRSSSPGTLGGVIAPMATDGKTHLRPGRQPLGLDLRQRRTRRRRRRIDRRTGRDRRRHAARSSGSRNSARPAFGAPTVVNDLVFATTFEGSVYALDADSGGEALVDDPAGRASTPASRSPATR